jgi:hypothetical protein
MSSGQTTDTWSEFPEWNERVLGDVKVLTITPQITTS